LLGLLRNLREFQPTLNVPVAKARRFDYFRDGEKKTLVERSAVCHELLHVSANGGSKPKKRRLNLQRDREFLDCSDGDPPPSLPVHQVTDVGRRQSSTLRDGPLGEVQLGHSAEHPLSQPAVIGMRNCFPAPHLGSLYLRICGQFKVGMRHMLKSRSIEEFEGPFNTLIARRMRQLGMESLDAFADYS